MENISASAVVSSKAKIGNNVEIGHFSIIEDDVEIGDNTVILSNVVVCSGTRIGKNCRVFTGAVVGSDPQDLKYEGEYSLLKIGDNTTIREYCTLNRGTKARGETTVGNNCLLMAYAHVGHDSDVGNNVILANSVNLAGHVEIEDFASVGGDVSIHQFCKIGTHAFIGGGFRVVRDVPPYILAASEPLRFYGLNTIGLRRRGFSYNVINTLKRMYSYISDNNLNLSQGLEKIDSQIEKIPEVEHVVDFIKRCERGLIKFKG